MKRTDSVFVAAMVAAGTMAVAAGAHAAQRSNQKAQQPAPAAAPQPQQQYNLSNAERNALAPLIAAHSAAVAATQQGQAPDWAAVQALLPAATAAAQGNDAKFLVARVQLSVALATNDDARKVAALDSLIANPSSPPDELSRYLNARAEIAFAANDFATAERLFERLLQASPGDQRLIGNLAIVRRRMGNSTGALETLLQNIAAQESASQAVEESLYRRARDIAYTDRDRRAAELAVRLARNYPTPANWRDAIRIYREISRPSASLTLDAMRLSRAAGALQGQADYYSYAEILHQAALAGEAKAVLDEGIARGAIRAQDSAVAQMLATANRRIGEDRTALNAQIAQARAAPTGRLARAIGDTLYGYGRYGEAAELYRAAIGKTGEDRNLLNLRLGAALAMAGNRAEAETVLRAVSGEPAGVAQLWLAWLARRTG
jgi:hypothetical protein